MLLRLSTRHSAASNADRRARFGSETPFAWNCREQSANLRLAAKLPRGWHWNEARGRPWRSCAETSVLVHISEGRPWLRAVSRGLYLGSSVYHRKRRGPREMGTGQSQTIAPVLGEHTCDREEFDGFDRLSWTVASPQETVLMDKVTRPNGDVPGTRVPSRGITRSASGKARRKIGGKRRVGPPCGEIGVEKGKHRPNAGSVSSYSLTLSARSGGA